MSGSRTLIIVGFVIVAVAVAVGGFVLFRNMRQEEPDTTPVPEEGGEPYAPPEVEGMQEIVVAAQDLVRGTRIIEGDNAVKVMSWPEGSVPADALTDLEAAYDRLARLDIPLDMPITEDMLTERGSDLSRIGSDAALQIPSGRVGYALAVAGNASVAWAIQPGDHIDVLISLLIVELDEEFQTELPNYAACVSVGEEETCEDGVFGRIEPLPTGQVVNVVPREGRQRPRMITQLTVQDAIVLRVGAWDTEEEEREVPPQETEETAEGEEGPPPPPPRPLSRWVTLIVTPQDALVLKYAEELGASMDMVLRSSEDADRLVTTEAVTLQYIFDRFTMEVPPKLPYGVTPPTVLLRNGAAGEVVSEQGVGVEYSRQHSVSSEAVVIGEEPEGY